MNHRKMIKRVRKNVQNIKDEQKQEQSLWEEQNIVQIQPIRGTVGVDSINAEHKIQKRFPNSKRWSPQKPVPLKSSYKNTIHPYRFKENSKSQHDKVIPQVQLSSEGQPYDSFISNAHLSAYIPASHSFQTDNSVIAEGNINPQFNKNKLTSKFQSIRVSTNQTQIVNHEKNYRAPFEAHSFNSSQGLQTKDEDQGQKYCKPRHKGYLKGNEVAQPQVRDLKQTVPQFLPVYEYQILPNTITSPQLQNQPQHNLNNPNQSQLLQTTGHFLNISAQQPPQNNLQHSNQTSTMPHISPGNINASTVTPNLFDLHQLLTNFNQQNQRQKQRERQVNQQINNAFNNSSLIYHKGAQTSIIPSLSQNLVQQFNRNDRTSFAGNLSKCQIQRKLCILKNKLYKLPGIYSFDSVANLQMKYLKQNHHHFAYLLKNLQLIKAKISCMKKAQSELQEKYKQISIKGIQKAVILKKTYQSQLYFKNILFSQIKIFSIISNQVKMFEPVINAYITRKQTLFINPDQGVALMAKYILQKYTLLLQTIKMISFDRAYCKDSNLNIFIAQIQMILQIGGKVSQFQKKIKTLRQILSGNNEYRLSSLLRKKIQSDANEQWYYLYLLQECTQILQRKGRRIHQNDFR